MDSKPGRPVTRAGNPFDQQAGSRTCKGIYRLDGNTLTIHVREGLAESCRPAGFHESKDGVTGEVYTRK
jgi:uncharacterized protein (TIGR03067 family)